MKSTQKNHFHYILKISLILLSIPIFLCTIPNKKTFAQIYTSPTFACMGGVNCVPSLSPSPMIPTNPNLNPSPMLSQIMNQPTPAPCVQTNSVNETEHASNRGAMQQLLSLIISILNQILQLLSGNNTTNPIPQTLPINPTPTTPSGNNNPTNNNPINCTPTPLPPVNPTIQVPPPTGQVSVPTNTPSTITPANPPAGGQTVSPTAKDGGNYSGYYFKIPNPAINDSITTTWTAVPLTCSGSGGNVSPWPGMGDTWDVEKNLAQLGIDMECKSGAGKYSTWTEALPAGSVYPPNTPISQGDEITATVTYKGNGKFDTTIANKQKGWSINTPMNYSSSYVPVGAEVINEEVGGAGVPKFAPLTFTSVLNIGGQQVQMATQTGLTRLNMNGIINTEALTGSTFISTYIGK